MQKSPTNPFHVHATVSTPVLHTCTRHHGQKLVAERTCSLRERSRRGNDQFRIVTGPVSMPFTGLGVKDWATCIEENPAMFSSVSGKKVEPTDAHVVVELLCFWFNYYEVQACSHQRWKLQARASLPARPKLPRDTYPFRTALGTSDGSRKRTADLDVGEGANARHLLSTQNQKIKTPTQKNIIKKNETVFCPPKTKK